MSLLTKDIQLSDVATAIDSIRKQAATLVDERVDASQEQTHMRATLSNLVVLVCEPCSKNISSHIDAVIATLAVQHPSRFFILRCLEGGSGGVSATVTSRCVLAQSGHGICTEEVSLKVTPQGAEVVPNFLLSLLVPDIETVLLLLNDPADLQQSGFGELVSRLSSMVDVLMYDSAAFEQYDTGVDSILKLLEQEPASGFSGASARDMAWLRLKRWQELLIEQFRAQKFVEVPGAVQKIRISQASRNPKDGVCPETVLLMSWFLECLDWSVERVSTTSSGEIVFNCADKQGNLVALEVISSVDTQRQFVNGDRVREVVVTTGAGTGNMRVAISRDSETPIAEIAVSVTADGSGSLASCDYSVRRVPFVVPGYDQIVSSRIVAQRVHTQRERCVHLAKDVAEKFYQQLV